MESWGIYLFFIFNPLKCSSVDAAQNVWPCGSGGPVSLWCTLHREILWRDKKLTALLFLDFYHQLCKCKLEWKINSLPTIMSLFISILIYSLLPDSCSSCWALQQSTYDYLNAACSLTLHITKGMLNMKCLSEIFCCGHWLTIRKQTLTHKVCVVQMYFCKCMFGAIWWLQVLQKKDLNQVPSAWCMESNSCQNIAWTGFVEWWRRLKTHRVCKTHLIGKTLMLQNTLFL